MNFDYTVVRSAKRRKLTITVERDSSVVIHVPEGITDHDIDQIVQSKQKWICEKITHPQKYQRLPHAPGKELVNGESALYLGRFYRIEIIRGKRSHIRFSQCFLIPEALAKSGIEPLRGWYISRAKEKLAPRVKRYAAHLGVDVAQVKIVDERYRWGSCTVNDNINLNWRLIKAPMFVIDYVIIHELAHLIEANHTARFWNIVRSQIANVDKAKDWLKENGQLLEEAL